MTEADTAHPRGCCAGSHRRLPCFLLSLVGWIYLMHSSWCVVLRETGRRYDYFVVRPSYGWEYHRGAIILWSVGEDLV